eukprot:12116761-Alexandrium_andersonii.AAC.1
MGGPWLPWPPEAHAREVHGGLRQRLVQPCLARALRRRPRGEHADSRRGRVRGPPRPDDGGGDVGGNSWATFGTRPLQTSRNASRRAR